MEAEEEEADGSGEWDGLSAEERAARRYSVYLLYSYKSTNTDAPAAARRAIIPPRSELEEAEAAAAAILEILGEYISTNNASTKVQILTRLRRSSRFQARLYRALYMCPHASMHVSAYYYAYVLILLCMCPHNMYVYVCPHATLYVSSY